MRETGAPLLRVQTIDLVQRHNRDGPVARKALEVLVVQGRVFDPRMRVS